MKKLSCCRSWLVVPACHYKVLRCLQRVVTGACCAGIVCSTAAYAETSSEEIYAAEPHLVFKKSVIVKDIEHGQAHTEQRIIKKGDHLWKILREQYNMSDTSINFFCKIAKAVNPDIEDINILTPEQNILLPFKFIPADGSGAPVIDVHDFRHVVKHGEHLGQILRSCLNLPDSIIFNRISMRLLHEANPGIADLNQIEPGQTITVPREVLAMHQMFSNSPVDEPETVEKAYQPDSAVQEPAGTEKPLETVAAAPDDAEELTEPVTAAATSVTEEPLVPSEHIETPVTPQPALLTFTDEPLSEEELEIKQMLTKMTRQLGGSDTSTGVEVITVDDSATLRLDHTAFPAYSFPGGKKVVLDLGGRLPEAMHTVISGHWDNAEVVSVQARDDMETIIGRVLEVCGFYKVEKDADYTVNRDAVQISVTGNWIVFRDNSLRNVFVINLARDGNPSITPALRSYLSGIGLDVMDVGLDAVESSEAPVSTAAVQAGSYTEITAEPAAMTDMILRMLGIDYKNNYQTDIFQNVYSGFSLEVIADRMFVHNGETHLIDFSNLPNRISTIITQQGIKLLQIRPDEETPDSVAGRVLEFCNAEFQPPPAVISFDGTATQSVRLTVPGYVVETHDGRRILTSSEINESVSELLHEMGVVIVKY
jgi:hypothetical protein